MIKAPLNIEVSYNTSGEQRLVSLNLKVGAVVEDAIEQSGVLIILGVDSAASLSLGIFGNKCTPKTVLSDHDRVEIYRPLRLSPTEARRLRASTAEAKLKTKG